jgi:CheY-like chemotaxis protein
MLPVNPPRTLRLGETNRGLGALVVEHQGVKPAATTTTETLLGVDDDETIRELVAAILECRGHGVYTAPHGAKGLSLLREVPIDLLVTDLDLPLMDGRELARRGRLVRPGLPILFMTGGIETPELERSLPEPPHSLLFKPFSFTALVGEVERLLSGCVGVPAQRRSLACQATVLQDDDDWGVGMSFRLARPQSGAPAGSGLTARVRRRAC